MMRKIWEFGQVYNSFIISLDLRQSLSYSVSFSHHHHHHHFVAGEIKLRKTKVKLNLPTMVANIRTPARKSATTNKYSISFSGVGVSPMVVNVNVDQ